MRYDASIILSGFLKPFGAKSSQRRELTIPMFLCEKFRSSSRPYHAAPPPHSIAWTMTLACVFNSTKRRTCFISASPGSRAMAKATLACTVKGTYSVATASRISHPLYHHTITPSHHQTAAKAAQDHARIVAKYRSQSAVVKSNDHSCSVSHGMIHGIVHTTVQ